MNNMTATENYLQQIGFVGNIDNLDMILDFMHRKNIYIETRIQSAMTALGALHEYSARVYHIPHGQMDKDFITETPNCADITGVLRLSVLYAARYLANKQK